MGISLTGLTPATTYDALIKVGDNGPITGALKVLSDGLGTNLPMEASTTAINFTGTLTQAGTTLQPTLVSGTNIKTINSTSLLGSGDIAVVTSPSGVAGAIQFSNGSAFASDASNLFWDDTNNRLGVGTNAPTATAHFKGSGSTSATTSLLVQNSAGVLGFSVTDDLVTTTGGTRLNIGSGSTAGSFSILNSGNVVTMGTGNNHDVFFNGFYSQRAPGGYRSSFQDTGAMSSHVASALVTMESTTKGFLPPRMTTTQKNAISSPATGLVLYDTTTNKLQCWNGTTWNDLF